MESATSYSCFRIYESCCLLRIFNSFLGEKRSVARRESVRFSTTKRFDSHREKKETYNLLVFNNLPSSKRVIYFQLSNHIFIPLFSL